MTFRLVHEGRLPARIVFAAGAIHRIPDECERLGLRRLLVVGGHAVEHLVKDVAAALGARAVALFSEIAEHVPENNARAVVAAASGTQADGVVTIGGGSTTGLGKVVALELGLPIVAVPTTYAGSEMTPIYGITGATAKRVGKDLRVLPATVLYDPVLAVTMPAELTAASGMNALAHCVEALWLPAASPFVQAFAERGIRALAAGLPAAVRRPDDLGARQETLVGASLAGAALGLAGTGLHHKICHILGGSYRLPHAAVHSAVLPHVVAYNATAAPDALATIGSNLSPRVGPHDAAAGIFDLATALRAPTGLADLGLQADDLPAVAAAAAGCGVDNPVPLDAQALLDLLQAAFAGRPPALPD